METVRISKTARQAFEWLGKMDIEVKPAIESGEMYEFEYKVYQVWLHDVVAQATEILTRRDRLK